MPRRGRLEADRLAPEQGRWADPGAVCRHGWHGRRREWHAHVARPGLHAPDHRIGDRTACGGRWRPQSERRRGLFPDWWDRLPRIPRGNGGSGEAESAEDVSSRRCGNRLHPRTSIPLLLWTQGFKGAFRDGSGLAGRPSPSEPTPQPRPGAKRAAVGAWESILHGPRGRDRGHPTSATLLRRPRGETSALALIFGLRRLARSSIKRN